MKKLILLIFILAAVYVNGQTTVIDSFFTGGSMRNFRIFLPTNYSSSQSLPLVLNFHGLGSNAGQQEGYTQFNLVADTGNFIVCYPNGTNNAWNVFGNDDILFVDTLIDVLNSHYNIDLNRVYATGLSNGGFLSNFLGCTLSNRIAAIAPVAGTASGFDLTCAPFHPVPVLYIHGTADAIVNYEGSPGISSALGLTSLWSEKNGCSGITDTVDVPDNNQLDLCTAEIITWRDCDNNSELIHYRIINGGHTWPGAFVPIGVTNQDFNASGVIWNFFNRHSLAIGINEVEINTDYSVFPNPSSSSVSIHIKNQAADKLDVYQIDGRKVFSLPINSDTFQLNTGDWTSGMYVFQFHRGNKIAYLKFFRN